MPAYACERLCPFCRTFVTVILLLAGWLTTLLSWLTALLVAHAGSCLLDEIHDDGVFEVVLFEVVGVWCVCEN